MGYRWVRADLRITPGWTHLGNSGNFRKNSGKTGNFQKIQKFTCDLSNESSWQAGSRGHKTIPEFQEILGNFWENSGKTWKKTENLPENHTFVARRATTPRVE